MLRHSTVDDMRCYCYFLATDCEDTVENLYVFKHFECHTSKDIEVHHNLYLNSDSRWNGGAIYDRWNIVQGATIEELYQCDVSCNIPSGTYCWLEENKILKEIKKSCKRLTK